MNLRRAMTEERAMFLSRCRQTVDTYAPPIGRSYRLLRDATHRRRSVETKYGFSLAGDPTMAAEGWESEEVQIFMELMMDHDAVLDIGANVGFYSCLAASRGKQTLAFEPSLRNLNFLYRNLWENNLSEVEVFPLGLGSRSGLGRIYGFGGISSFVPGWAQARVAHGSTVPLSTLDTIAGGRFHGKKLLIKMDVEGFELEVLRGATKTLSMEPKPTWLVEILLNGAVIPGQLSSNFTETFHLFWEHGYACRMLNAERTRVEPEDVNRWVAAQGVDGEIHDFLFSASALCMPDHRESSADSLVGSEHGR
jgi:FkbM family methyltransferase